MDANPEVIFYDYTKLDSATVADNHHLTYSSTGVSQTVGNDKVINKEQNWDRMKRLLDKGSNVAMAFTSKSDMPSVVVDEASGKEYQVWNGDNYDARFLDPKREDGVGMIVGLTNKAATLKAPTAAKETNGFFIDYDKARDGDRVVIQDQSKFVGSKVIPITKVAEEPKKFALREFKMSDLPESGTYTLKAGTEIFHGAHKARAEEIKKAGKTLLLPSKVKEKSGGGDLYEGNLIWFGDRDLATRHSKSAVDTSKAKYDAEEGFPRDIGEAFSTVTDRDYELANRYYELSEEEANILNKELALPDYKQVNAGDSLYSAAYRAHSYGRSNVNRYQVERAGEFSDGLAKGAKALGFDGIFDGTGIAFTADNGIELGAEAVPMKRFSLREPNAWYYSQLEKGIEATPDRIFGKAPQVKSWLASNASKMGVKSEELQFSGINDWLDLQGDKKVSKDDVLNYLQQGGVRLEDVTRSGDKYETSYEDYQLDGGTNYQEMLLTLPSKLPNGWSVKEIDMTNKSSTVRPFEVYDGDELIGMGYSRQDAIDHAYSRLNIKRSDEFRSTHFQAANILAHIRMNDRKDPQGNKVLFIEEIQSDWHQTGRKRGYATPETGKIFGKIEKQQDYYERGSMTKSPATYKIVWDDGTMSGGYSKEQAELKAREGKSNAKAGVPNAPFKDTKAWTGLALKRIIAYASENGYDKVAFINGDQSADRYDLSKQINKISVSRNESSFTINAVDQNNKPAIYKNIPTLIDLDEYVGKDLAEKIKDDFSNKSGDRHEYSGLDLKVGGKGMINYYDNILPQVASDVLKKIGGGNLEKVIVPVRTMVPSNIGFTYSVVSDLTNNNAYVENVKTEERVTEPMSYEDAKDWLRAHDPATSNPQTGFSITEKIREKVGEGLPLFSLRSQLSDSLNERINVTTTKRQEKGYVERIIDAMSPTAITRIRQGLINKYESIEQLSNLRGERVGGDQLLAENSAIAAALQSDRAAGIAASSFKDGVPVFDKGYTYVSDMDGKVKGLIPILEPLMRYNDPYIFQTFQYYAGTRRGRRLDAEGREKTFTKEDIAYGKELETQFPEFSEVFNEYQKYNQGLVKYMMDTGVISAQEAKTWTENWDYIPFYRQIDGEKTAGPKVFSPIAGVAKPKKLKGSEAPLDDFMETIVRNARAAIEAGLKNEAARRVIRDVTEFGLGERLPSSQAGTDVVSVKENGITVYYRVADPLLVESLKGLNLPQLPFMDFLSAPANLLRNFVTKDPGFIIANLGRDSMQAWITSGTDMKPLVDTFKQFGRELLNQSPEAFALAKSGLTGYDFAGDVKSTAQQVEKELRKRTGTRTKKEQALLPITAFWDMLEKGSHASDMATRAEVYKRTLERTGSEAEAFYQAMEVMNFSRKGNSAVIRILSAMIPFFNARVQGLDVLYRTGFGKAAMENKEKIQKAFIFRSMVLLGTSVMYWAMVSDDDEYKKLSKEEKDNYWIIPAISINDKPFRFPIPFELGVLFKVLPERALEYSFGTDTGKDVRDSLLRNAMSTLSFNPIPQAVLPAVENITNHSFFTGEPIVGKGQEGFAPQYQYTGSTSELAKKVGRELDYSPAKIENFIRGYTGTLGSYAMMMLDSALTQEGDAVKASKRMEQLPVIKRFFAGDSGTISAYYDLKEEVDTVVQTVNMLQRTGNVEDLKEYLQENKKLYALKNYVGVLDKGMKQLSQASKMIGASKTMTADEKRESIDKIHEAQLKLTERVRILRKNYE
jgi:hypothetical protein